jgi:DNA replication protein DnaC
MMKNSSEMSDIRFKIAWYEDAIERKRKQMERLRKKCNMGERFSKRTFETWDHTQHEEAFRKAFDYAAGFQSVTDGNGLIFTGDLGTGKTHLAAAIGNFLMENQSVPVYFASYIDILNAIKDSFDTGERTRDMITNVDLLIIDDLGKEQATEWSRETLFTIINHRYEHDLPMVITTNYSAGQLQKRIGAATVSRIAEMCEGIRMTGSDWRLKNGKTQ